MEMIWNYLFKRICLRQEIWWAVEGWKEDIEKFTSRRLVR
jgi:hypothetical protein